MPTLYCARGGSSASSLYTVNSSTGAVTAVGATGRSWSALAFDPTTGTLYGGTGTSSPLDPKSLCTVNKLTGVATLIGGFGTTNAMADLSFDSAGNLYGYQAGTRKLYSINKATGHATLIGTGTLGSQFGNGFEIDASGVGYLFNDSQSLSPYYKIALANGATSLLGTLTSALGNFAIGACSFGPDQAMWFCTTDSGTNGTLATVTPAGVVTAIGSMGITSADALAWDGGVKPNPWFTYPDLAEEFDAAPVVDAEACSTPLGALITSDGASQGPSSLKVDAQSQDSWIQFAPPVAPSTTTWVYTSFAIYIPSWAFLWDGGNQWAPQVITLVDFGLGAAFGAYLLPSSPTTGTLEYGNGGTFVDSTPIPDGGWVAVEVAWLSDDGSGNRAIRFWINGTDSGVLTVPGTTVAPDTIILGDNSWGGSPPANGVRYYLDDFHWSINGRIGPVDLSAAFFNGVGSGSDFDACTGDPVSARPVDDFYTDVENHTLNVAAPGVMSNDILPTTVSLNTGCAHGSVILNSDGSFSYTPNPGFLGVDTFVYNGNGGTATVTITVSGITPRAVFASRPVFKVAQ